MNTKNTIQILVIALAMMFTLTINSTMVFGQDKADKQIINSPAEEQGSTLEGTWQLVVTPRDCQTGVPAPFSFKALHTFMQGGTMLEDAANPFDGPYRTSGHGIWKHTSGRNYTYVLTFYSYEPDRTFNGSVKIRVNSTLSRDSNSLTGNDTIAVFDPTDNLVFTGCDNITATRLTF